MIDGIDNDDQYRMVEDELLAVAHTFTAHLHAAAYQRLRAKAKSQTAAALRSLARPTTTMGVSTDAKERVARKAAVDRQKAKHAAALRAMQDKGKGKENQGEDDGEDAAEEETPWAGTALQDLMESDPRKARPSLVSLASVAGQKGPSTASSNSSRPAVAASKAAVADSDDDSDDDDDLDGPPVQKKAPLPTTTITPPAPRQRVEPKRIPTPRDTLPERRSVSFAPKTRDIPPKAAAEEGQYDEGEDDDLDDDDAGDMLQQLRKRRAQEKENRLQERKRRREQKKEQDDNASMDTIPSFL